MYYLRNLGRRPVRTALTILGITIGIWALVVFGSMANKINALVDGGIDLLRRQDHASRRQRPAGRVRQRADVADDGRQDPGGRRRGRRRLGRDDADGRPGERRDDGRAADDHGQRARRRPGARDVSRPRSPRAGPGPPPTRDPNVTVLGSDIARKFDKHAGDTIILKGEPFTVIGVLEPTLTAPDQAAIDPARCRPEAVRARHCRR